MSVSVICPECGEEVPGMVVDGDLVVGPHPDRDDHNEECPGVNCPADGCPVLPDDRLAEAEYGFDDDEDSAAPKRRRGRPSRDEVSFRLDELCSDSGADPRKLLL